MGGDLGLLWALQLGDTADQSARDLRVTRQGYVVSTARFNGAVAFDGGPSFTVADGNEDALITRQDPTGGLVWARQLRGGSVMPVSVAANPSGGALVTGHFTGTLSVDGFPGSIKSSFNDVFLLSFDPSGTPKVMLRWGDGTESLGTSIAYLPNGDLILSGHFSKSIDFGDGVLTNVDPNPQGSDLFLTRLSSDGVLRWSKQIASTGLDAWIVANNIPGSPDIIVYGQCGGAMPFLGGQACSGAFLARVGATGGLVWSKQFMGTLAEHPAMALSPSGDIVLAGSYTATALDFGGPPLPAPAGEDVYVAKFTANGDYVFSKVLGAAGGTQTASGVAIDPQGNIYVAGEFKGLFDIGSPQGALSAKFRSIFLAELDAMGKPLWLHSFSGQGPQSCTGVDLDADGGLLAFSGSIAGSMPLGDRTLQSAGGLDAVVVALRPR
jgi:hypothetical protein